MGYKNGFFQLVVKNGKTYVRLFPPKNGGSRIDVKELADYLESENIFDYDINHLNQMLEVMKCLKHTILSNRKENSLHPLEIPTGK